MAITRECTVYTEIMLVFLTLLALLGASNAQTKCVDVKPTAKFQSDTFKGNWKEIGKIQTPGGAIWQEGCVCNQMDFTPDANSANGDAAVKYQCNDETPSGEIREFGGKLEATSQAGKFKQVIFEFLPKVDWTVLVQEEDYAMTYDCTEMFEGALTNYCIHIVSRKGTLDAAIVQKLRDQAEQLGLNPEKIEYEAIQHNGCI